MKTMNEEQKIAHTLHNLNRFIGGFAFIPALLCWLITIGFLLDTEPSQGALFMCSSILLIIFYGYIFRCPCIHKIENYNKEISFWYWMIVLLTNLLTGLLFISTEFAALAFIPAVPLVFAVLGLIAHYNINAKKINSNDSN